MLPAPQPLAHCTTTALASCRGLRLQPARTLCYSTPTSIGFKKASSSNNKFLKPCVRGLPESATLAINQRSKQLEKEGHTIYRFGFGQSPFPVHPNVVKQLAKHAAKAEYLPVCGLEELRHAVATYHNARGDGEASFSAADVMVGPGSKELMFILNICLQAKVLLPIPSWVSYGPQASLFGNEVHWLSTRFENKWLLTAEELDTFCKKHSSTVSTCNTTMLLVLNYPSNPTGASYNEQQLKELGEVARRHHLFILSDEIYGELHHEGCHLSFSKFYPEGTIISSGISKWCGAGGWRLGTFLFPPTTRSILPADLKQAVSAVASESFSAVSAPVQHAAIAAYDRRLKRGDGALGDSFEDDYYLPGQRLVLKSLAGRFVQRLREDGLRVAQPDGGFYLWLDFSPFRESLFRSKSIRSSDDLVMKLLEETGVALLAGSHFGSCSGHLQNDAHQHGGAEEPLTARLAYVNFDGEKALSAAVTHLQHRPPPAHDGLLSDDFLRQHCGRTMSGLEHLLSWLPSS